MLKPYCGNRMLAGTDRSLTKSYDFNSLGFRGEEHDPDAAATIFICGCSNAFGTGLNLEETWAHHVKLGYAARYGLDSQDVNVLNFSQGAASNDYIVRTLLTQCSAVRPSLVIAQFAWINRAEAFADGQPYCIGSWIYPSVSVLRRWLLHVPWSRKWVTLRLMWQASRHVRAYSQETGVANSLRNMLLLQFYCRAEGIPCIMTWADRHRLDDPVVRENPALAPLIALLDPNCLCDFTIRDPDICTDAAADGRHPGPGSNTVFAARLLDFHDAVRRDAS